MKTVFCLISAALIILTSCGNKFSLQKRRYAKGFYLSGIHSKKKTVSNEKNTTSENDRIQVSVISSHDDRYQNNSFTTTNKVGSDLKAGSEIANSAHQGPTVKKYRAGTQRLVLPEMKDKLTSFSGFLDGSHKYDKKYHPVNKMKLPKKKNIVMDFIVGYYVICFVIAVIALIYCLATGIITFTAINWGLVLLYVLLIGICILVGHLVRG